MSDARAWTRAALFGCLWGALELSLGSVLHLSRLPFSSLAMAAVGLACLLTLRRLSPVAGVCLAAGAVAVVVKVFGIGGLYPGPLIGIAAEAALVEIATGLLPASAGATAGGALVFAWGPLQRLATTRIVAGREAFEAVLALAARGAGSLGLEQVGVVWAFAAMVATVSAVGAVVGWLAWRLAGRVAGRIGVAP